MKLFITLQLMLFFIISCEEQNVNYEENVQFDDTLKILSPIGMNLINSSDAIFLMGDTVSLNDISGPPHTVLLTYNYWMDTVEVTKSEYYDVMSDPIFGYKGFTDEFFEKGGRPVSKMNWHDVILYCNARTKRDGLDTVYAYDGIDGLPGHGSELLNLKLNIDRIGYRLPTEAEWEYACRAGSSALYFWGDTSDYYVINEYAWYDDNSYDYSHIVGQKLPNAFGLYDMIGNVAEFCIDSLSQYTTDSLIDPVPKQAGRTAIFRGGTYTSDVEFITSSFRGALTYEMTNITVGFRCVINNEIPEAWK